jgi:hypothetical protein
MLKDQRKQARNRNAIETMKRLQPHREAGTFVLRESRHLARL